jgi:asparagine synthetase B (glutamine-hydrolysing)
MLAFWGYIWDQQDLERRTGSDFADLKHHSIGQMLLTLYNNEGVSGFLDLNGRFAIAIWKQAEKVLHLITDRCGLARLYYYSDNRRILFASEYKAIVSHEAFSRKLDEQALTEFITFGYCMGSRTLFQGIKLLPHGSLLTYKPEKPISLSRYWDYSFYDGTESPRTKQHYLSEFFCNLDLATRNQTEIHQKLALPLSGGLDSRTLGGMLYRLRGKKAAKSFSYGNPDCFDVAYGRKIAVNLGFEHSFIPINSTYLRDHAQSFVWLLEGTVNCINAHMLLTYPFIRNNGIEAVVTGFLGDTLCSSGIYTEPILGHTDEDWIIRTQYKLNAEIMTNEEMLLYMKKSFYKRVKELPFESLRSRYRRCPSTDPYFATKYVILTERQRRYSSFNLYVFDHVCCVISPFVDSLFLTSMLHYPPLLMLKASLYKNLISDFLPQAASAPWNKTRLPINASNLRKAIHWRWQVLMKNRFVRSTIGKRYAMMHDNYLKSNEAIRTGSKDFVLKNIKNNSFLAEFFDMDKVHKLLDDVIGGNNNDYGKITALLTLSLWHSLFVEGNGFKSRVTSS